MILNAKELGISKKELFEDYYLEEFKILVDRYNQRGEDEEEVGADKFF